MFKVEGIFTIGSKEKKDMSPKYFLCGEGKLWKIGLENDEGWNQYFRQCRKIWEIRFNIRNIISLIHQKRGIIWAIRINRRNMIRWMR